MNKEFRHTHASTVKAGEVSISELQSERIDLELAISKLTLDFHRKHPFVSLELKVSKFYGEPQITAILTLS